MPYKMEFANQIQQRSLGKTAFSIMTECEKFGMTYGCREDCPQLQDGKCEIYDSVDEFLEEGRKDE